MFFYFSQKKYVKIKLLEREEKKQMGMGLTVDWNGDKVVADGAALSALQYYDDGESYYYHVMEGLAHIKI